ncbi:MAG: hypothetical protein LBK73_02325 [Treponema sp.]|jgi:predicted lipoprotein|nr:hypothetical protein [Treponema sp.]
MPDYIPSGDDRFLTWAENLVFYANSKASVFNETQTIALLQAKLSAYQTAFNTANRSIAAKLTF